MFVCGLARNKTQIRDSLLGGAATPEFLKKLLERLRDSFVGGGCECLPNVILAFNLTCASLVWLHVVWPSMRAVRVCLFE